MSPAIDPDDYDNTRSSASLVVGALIPSRLEHFVVAVVAVAVAAAALVVAALAVVAPAAVAALAAVAAAAAVVAATVVTGDGRQWFEWEEGSVRVATRWIRWVKHDMVRCPDFAWEVDTRRPTLMVKDRNVVMGRR